MRICSKQLFLYAVTVFLRGTLRTFCYSDCVIIGRIFETITVRVTWKGLCCFILRVRVGCDEAYWELRVYGEYCFSVEGLWRVLLECWGLYGEYCLSVGVYGEYCFSVGVYGESCLSVGVYGEYCLSVGVYGESCWSVRVYSGFHCELGFMASFTES